MLSEIWEEEVKKNYSTGIRFVNRLDEIGIFCSLKEEGKGCKKSEIV